MGHVRVNYNHLPAIAGALPGELEEGVDGTARDGAAALKPRVWFEWGTIKSTTAAHEAGTLHAEIWCGLHEGRGFYSRFLEWGTVYINAKPVVGPLAEEYRPIYARNMEKAIEKAVRSR